MGGGGGHHGAVLLKIARHEDRVGRADASSSGGAAPSAATSAGVPVTRGTARPGGNLGWRRLGLPFQVLDHGAEERDDILHALAQPIDLLEQEGLGIAVGGGKVGLQGCLNDLALRIAALFPKRFQP